MFILRAPMRKMFTHIAALQDFLGIIFLFLTRWAFDETIYFI